MREHSATKLNEFVLDPAQFFEGHRDEEKAYRGLFGVFTNIEAYVESSLDCGGIEIATRGIWKLYIHIVDTQEESPWSDDLGDGVLQPRMRLNRAEFDAASTLLDKKHYVAAVLANYVTDLGSRWNFDGPALARLLLACTNAGETVEFHVPEGSMIMNASNRRGARWAVRTTFCDSVVGAEIRDDDAALRTRIDLLRIAHPSFGFIAMFVSTIRWTGDKKVMLRSKPVTDILYGAKRVTVLLQSRPEVQFRRVPARRPDPNMTEFARSEYRFEWRLDLRDPAWLPPFQVAT